MFDLAVRPQTDQEPPGALLAFGQAGGRRQLDRGYCDLVGGLRDRLEPPLAAVDDTRQAIAFSALWRMPLGLFASWIGRADGS